MRIPWMRRPKAAENTGASPATDPASAPAGVPSPFPEPAQPGVQLPAASPAQAGGAATPDAGPKQRRGLVPSWFPWAAGGAAILVLIIVIIALLVGHPATVRVPDLTNLDRATATRRAQSAGLVLVVRDTAFSATVRAGAVITQSPASGQRAADGSIVHVDLSAGSETFAMPDVLGKSLDAARTILRARGLDVQFQTAASDAAQGTVIASVPSSGATVTTGATVRLTVAAGVSATDTLLPSDLSGVSFVLDPAPAPNGATTDASFDVARRVRALLEASGAKVTVTRTVTDTSSSATLATRLQQAKATTSTALVGFAVASSGSAGLQVLSVPDTGTAAATFAQSNVLSQALVTALRPDFASITTTAAVGDTVMEGVGTPAARVQLGSNSSSSDKLAFSDPQWADNVARDVYRALAQTYGKR